MSPNIAVKCPICGKVKVVRQQKERQGFRCCKVNQPLVCPDGKSNVVAVGMSLKRAMDKLPKEQKVIEQPEPVKNKDEKVEVKKEKDLLEELGGE